MGASSSSHEVVAGAHGWENRAATALDRHGFVVLRSPRGRGLVDGDVCERMHRAATGRLEWLVRWCEACGLAPGARFCYREVAHRMPQPTGGRYELSIPSAGATFDVECPMPRAEEEARARVDPPAESQRLATFAAAWALVQTEVERWARPVLARLPSLPAGASNTGAEVSVEMAGVHMSRPGTVDQRWHSDGDAPGLICAFLPLVRLTAANGATEFRSGTHCRPDGEGGGSGAGGEAGGAPTQPLLRRGELLLYDYRVLHRGRANTSGDTRPLAYVLLNCGRSRDLHNFPRESLGQHPALVAQYG